MKKITTIIAALLFSITVWAQSPEKISYQAIIRDASDMLVTDQAIGMQISILQGSASGIAVYTETHTVSTNVNGLVTVQIGTGVSSDDFASIDWSSGTYFIKTETDPTGGNAYTITGTSQLLSVPYALYAKTSGSSTPGPKGDTGEQGIQGEKGDTGAQGLPGEKGDKGDAGTDGILPNGSEAGNTPYWNGTSWVTNNSNVFNNGGNVGIGTNSPTSAKLVVSTSVGAQALDLSSTDGYANMRVIQNTNSPFDKDLYLGYNSGAGSKLHLFSNNVETMTVSGGNVGIGTSVPGIPLNFANVLGDKVSLWGNSGNTYGFGIQSGLLQIHSDGSSSDVAFGHGSSAAFTETMRIKGNGNVGIGTVAPNEKLEVVGASLRTAFRSAAENQDVTLFLGTPFDANAKNKVAIIADAQTTYSRANLHFCLNGSANNGLEAGINDSKMMIDYNGNVGIGSNNQFTVNNSGNITKINNVTTSFPSAQGAASTYLKNDGSGNLTWATIPTPETGGIELVDANNVSLGEIISVDSYGATVRTSTGYLFSITWEGYGQVSWVWYVGGCSGTMFLNAGSSIGRPRYGKEVFKINGSYFQPNSAEVNANGVILSKAVSYDAKHFGDGVACEAGTGNNSGWQIEPVSASAVGLPATIALPLSIK